VALGFGYEPRAEPVGAPQPLLSGNDRRRFNLRNQDFVTGIFGSPNLDEEDNYAPQTRQEATVSFPPGP